MVNNTESGTDSIESAGSMVTCVPHLEKEISVVEGQDTIDRVEKELAVIVGDFDPDADNMSIEHKEEQNGDMNRVEEECNTFGDSVSDEAMRELLDKQHGSSENKGNELSAIFGSGASQINFEPVKSSTPICEDPNKRSASVGDEGDDSRKENLTGLDHLKRLRLDSSANDSDKGRNLDLQAPLVPFDPSYVLTIHDAEGGGGLDLPHDSHLQQEDDEDFGDNEDLDTGGGHEKFVI